MAKKKMGRPSGFNRRMAEQITDLAQRGLTNDQIAEELGIGRTTLIRWLGGHQDLRAAVNASKRVADELVEAALLQRAMGYEHKAVKIQYDSELKEFVTHEYIERFPPDPKAMEFWLKNRRPKAWRERKEVEHSGKIGLESLVLGSMKDEE